MSSIPLPALNVRAPQPEDPLNQYAKALQLKGIVQQQTMNQEQLKAAQMQNTELARQQREEQAYMDILGKHNGNIEEALPDLSRSVSPKTFISIQNSLIQQKKAQMEFSKLSTEQQSKAYELSIAKMNRLGQLAGAAQDQHTYEAAISTAAQEGLIPPEQAQTMLQSPFNPNTVKFFQQQAMTASQQQEQKLKELQFAETQKQNAATNSYHNQQLDLTKRGQDITVRGQNLTDTRAREQNAIANRTNGLKQQELEATLRQQQATREGSAASIDDTIATFQRLKSHPGLKAAVGVKNPMKGALGFYTVPGTDAADFEAELDTAKAQTFVPMVQQLRGMGQLSDAEGKKLTDAIGALSTKMSEGAFRSSMDRIIMKLTAASKRAKGVAGSPATGYGTSSEQQSTRPSLSNFER